jgi:hypothetical protein
MKDSLNQSDRPTLLAEDGHKNHISDLINAHDDDFTRADGSPIRTNSVNGHSLHGPNQN